MKLCSILMAAALLLVSGCSSVPKGFESLPKAGQRIERPGYSVQSPREKGWLLAGKTARGILLGKDLNSKSHSFLMGVTALKTDISQENPKAFMDAVKKQKDANTDPDRFVILANEYRLLPEGDFAFEYHSKVEDRGTPNKDGAPFLVLETVGRGFMHPKMPGLYIEVFYSERAKPGEHVRKLQSTGRAFIESFRLE